MLRQTALERLARCVNKGIMNQIRSLLKKYNNMSVVTKATLWFIFASTMQKAVSVLTTPIFTRLMSTEQYGQFSAYHSWLQIFTILTTLRLNWSIFNKGMSKYKEDRDNYTSTMQTLTFCLAGVLLIVYLIFRRQFNAMTELPTFVMLAIFAELFVTPAIDFWTLRKRYEYQYRQVVARTVAMVLLNALLGILAVFVSEEKGYARILSVVFVNICFGVPIFCYNRRRATIWFKAEYAIYALGFNLKLLLHYISQYILDQFDRIMIQKMVSFAAAGIYSAAYNAGMLLRIVSQSITNALVPWMYEHLEKREFRKLDDVLFGAYLVVAGVVLAFIAFAPELMKILADEKFHEGVYVIPPVVLGLFFSFVYTTIANVEFYYEQTKLTSAISVVGAAANIVLNYFGIRMFGYIAAAYTTLICYLLFCISHYAYTIRKVKQLFQLKTVFQVRRLLVLSLLILAAGISMIFLYDYLLVRYGMAAAVFAVAYWKRERLLATVKDVRGAKKKVKK